MYDRAFRLRNALAVSTPPTRKTTTIMCWSIVRRRSIFTVNAMAAANAISFRFSASLQSKVCRNFEDG